jgi:ABC-2 type transport system ATP-binding protein
MMAVIEIEGLTKRFGPVVAVDRLCFEVPAGTVVGFLGPNGAGKTTTLRMLLGLVEPSAGRATINGRPYGALTDSLHSVGAVLEASSFHPGRTARNHLRIHALAGGAGESRITEALETVGLAPAADRRVGGFSLGMRQRLGLATALLHEPEVVILDEPANGLDPEGVRWLRDLVRSLAEQGRTVLVSSHILAEVAQTVDSVVILKHGQLVAQSSLAELTAGAAQVVRVRTPKAEELVKALSRDGVVASVDSDDWIEVCGATPEHIGLLAAEMSVPIFETISTAANLEDVFFGLTGEGTKEAKR